MSRRRYRTIMSGQGWVELPQQQAERLAAAVLSPQRESVLSAEGRVRVHRLPHVEAWGDRKRTNVSGKLDVKPVGAVRGKA